MVKRREMLALVPVASLAGCAQIGEEVDRLIEDEMGDDDADTGNGTDDDAEDDGTDATSSDGGDADSDDTGSGDDGDSDGDPGDADDGDGEGEDADDEPPEEPDEIMELSSDISEDTTFTPNTLYRITSTISVEARLTIEPGTTLEFEEGTELRLNSGGVIEADGTEDAKITFTGTQEQPGWWGGVYVRSSESTLNLLNHVVIEYGGGDRPANLTVGHSNRVRSGQRMTLTNSTLRYSDGAGLRVFSRTSLNGSGNNVYTDNDVPVYINANQVPYLDGDSSYHGNETDLVLVDSDDIEGDVTIQALDVPYSPGTLGIDGHVTIESGAEFRFREGGGVQVGSDGVLVAEGVRGEHVVFSATHEIPGWWRGIYLSNSDSLLNTLDFVTVEYAGRDRRGSIQIGRGNRLRNARLSVTNSTIRHSSSAGIAIDGNSDANDNICEVNQFEDNADGNCIEF